MSTLGVVLIGVGIVTAIIAVLIRRSGAMGIDWWSIVQELAPGSAEQARSGAAVALNGTGVVPETPAGPLRDPLDGQESVWWRCVSTERWQEPRRHTSKIHGKPLEQMRWVRRSRQLSCSESGVPFQLTDGSGAVWVNTENVRVEDVNHSVSRRDDTPPNGATLTVGPNTFFTEGDTEARRGAYVAHTCEYIPAGIELLVSGRVRRGPNGTMIGFDSDNGLQVCSRDRLAQPRETEDYVEHARFATVLAAASLAAGAVVFMLA